MTPDTKPLALRAIPDLVYEALRFANFAAGEGICPASEDDGRDPAQFLSEYTDRTDDEDWDTVAARIRDHLAALLREAGGWRPIESAPHNEPVLLAWKSHGLEAWNFEAGVASHGTRYPNGASSMSFHGQATHWRPLPPAPEAPDAED